MWPLLTYPTYKYAHYEGDKIAEYEAYAVFKDSTEVNVLPKDVNIGFWKFRWDLVPAIRKNNRSRIKDYVSLIKERYKRKPVGDEEALAAAMRKSLDEEHDPERLRRRAMDFSVDQAVGSNLDVLFPNG